MRISDWSSDVCSSDLAPRARARRFPTPHHPPAARDHDVPCPISPEQKHGLIMSQDREIVRTRQRNTSCPTRCGGRRGCEAETCPPHASCHLALIVSARSEEHTSELQSLMRISYAVFCLKKKTTKQTNTKSQTH